MSKIVSVKGAIEEAVNKSRKLKESIIRARWPEVVGELYKKSSIVYLKDRILYIIVDGPAYVQHMSMSKKKYVDKANELLEGSFIDDIKIKLGRVSVEEYFHEQKVEDKEVIEDFDEEIEKEARELYKDIEDIELRERLIHLKLEAQKRDGYLEVRGYRRCTQCGSYHHIKEGSICSVCKNKSDQKKERDLFRMFQEDLYTTYEEAIDEITGLTQKEYNFIKRRKLDKLYREATFLIKDKRENLAKILLKDYIKIETGEKSGDELELKSESLIASIIEKMDRS